MGRKCQIFCLNIKTKGVKKIIGGKDFLNMDCKGWYTLNSRYSVKTFSCITSLNISE